MPILCCSSSINTPNLRDRTATAGVFSRWKHKGTQRLRRPAAPAALPSLKLHLTSRTPSPVFLTQLWCFALVFAKMALRGQKSTHRFISTHSAGVQIPCNVHIPPWTPPPHILFRTWTHLKVIPWVVTPVTSLNAMLHPRSPAPTNQPVMVSCSA